MSKETDHQIMILKGGKKNIPFYYLKSQFKKNIQKISITSKNVKNVQRFVAKNVRSRAATQKYKKPKNIKKPKKYFCNFIYIGRNQVFNLCDAFYQLGKDCLVLTALFYAFFTLKHYYLYKVANNGIQSTNYQTLTRANIYTNCCFQLKQ